MESLFEGGRPTVFRVETLAHLFFQPSGGWLWEECLAQDFMHYFHLTPFGVIATNFLLSYLAIKQADLQ